MNFTFTLTAVAVMLLYAVPGYLLIKTRAVKKENIPAFSKLLLYVSQPCLVLYSFGKMSFSKESFLNLAVCFLLTLTFQASIVLLLFLAFKRKRKEILWRLITVAAVFSNCGFLGVPILEKLLPDHPEAVAYSSVFMLTMNMIGWTLGMYIISLDRKYISPKKIFLNPATISLAIALPLYFFGIDLPDRLGEMLTLLGRMSTPLCMIIMGMRLATVKPKEIFFDPRQYFAVILNQLAYPLLIFGLLYFLPVDQTLKTTLVILCACPVASIVQNYAEILGEGQEKSANMVLLGTISSVLTVPLVCLIL